eukprot:scaffold20574_cov101-Isochrysis_galbana.AAC.2
MCEDAAVDSRSSEEGGHLRLSLDGAVEHLALRPQLLDDSDAQLLSIGHLPTATHDPQRWARGLASGEDPPRIRAGCGQGWSWPGRLRD